MNHFLEIQLDNRYRYKDINYKFVLYVQMYAYKMLIQLIMYPTQDIVCGLFGMKRERASLALNSNRLSTTCCCSYINSPLLLSLEETLEAQYQASLALLMKSWGQKRKAMTLVLLLLFIFYLCSFVNE